MQQSQINQNLSYRGLPYHFEVRRKSVRNDCKISRLQPQKFDLDFHATSTTSKGPTENSKKMLWDNLVFPIDTKNSIGFFVPFFWGQPGLVGDSVIPLQSECFIFKSSLISIQLVPSKYRQSSAYRLDCERRMRFCLEVGFSTRTKVRLPNFTVLIRKPCFYIQNNVREDCFNYKCCQSSMCKRTSKSCLACVQNILQI